jgi:hypothetical protein
MYMRFFGCLLYGLTLAAWGVAFAKALNSGRVYRPHHCRLILAGLTEDDPDL